MHKYKYIYNDNETIIIELNYNILILFLLEHAFIPSCCALTRLSLSSEIKRTVIGPFG